MKKITLSLLVILMAFAAGISMTSCSPTAGLDEISFEDIANANLSGTYSVSTKTVNYKSDGTVDSSKTEDDTLSAASVKTSIATSKLAIEGLKLISSKSSGRVCANKNYSKIVTYVYSRDNDDHLVYEIITTYTKK